ncbi:hypothetical protein BH23PLA1_BH23PLA1_33640 [soil metagenome]
MVGSGLLLGAAMASMILMLCGVRPRVLAHPLGSTERRESVGREMGQEDAPVSIRLEFPVPMGDPAVPVAFGGYLLPVDSQEEIHHAGG